MALITTTGGVTHRPPDDVMPHRVYAAEGHLWAEKMGFREIEDERTLVEIGYSVAMLGEHNPDLVIRICEQLSVPYKVTTQNIIENAFTYQRRKVTVDPPPEPEPLPATPTPKRDYKKQRTEKLDLRLSPDERDELDAAAKQANVSRGQYVRDLLISRINADHAWRGEQVDPEWLAQAEAKFEKQRQRWRGRSRRRAS